MSNDLISRSALLKELNEFCGKQRYLVPENVWNMIEKAATAYDVDNVVSELENLKKCYRGDEDAIMKPMSFENYIQEIIDLAKAGGTNE